MKQVCIFLLFVCLSVEGGIRPSSRNFRSSTQRAAESRNGTSVSSGMGHSSAGVMTASAKSEAPVHAETVRVEFLGPTSGWGIIKTSSPFYNLQGKNQGKLPAGVVFSYDGIRKTKVNPMLVVTWKTRRVPQGSGPYLVDCTRVAAYEGKYEEMDPSLVERLSAYFTVKGEMEQRREELKESFYVKNPYYETARRSRKAYEETLAEAASLETKMNAARGTARSRLQEQLRTLKYRQARIQEQAAGDAEKYKTWKTQNPIPSSLFLEDPRLRELQGKLDAVGVDVRALVPKE